MQCGHKQMPYVRKRHNGIVPRYGGAAKPSVDDREITS